MLSTPSVPQRSERLTELTAYIDPSVSPLTMMAMAIVIGQAPK